MGKPDRRLLRSVTDLLMRLWIRLHTTRVTLKIYSARNTVSVPSPFFRLAACMRTRPDALLMKQGRRVFRSFPLASPKIQCCRSTCTFSARNWRRHQRGTRQTLANTSVRRRPGWISGADTLVCSTSLCLRYTARQRAWVGWRQRLCRGNRRCLRLGLMGGRARVVGQMLPFV